MKSEEMGKFYLIDENGSRYPLIYGANIVNIVNKEIILGEVLENTNSSFIINLSKDKMHILKMHGDIRINDTEINRTCTICDNTSIYVEGIRLHFIFIYEPNKLESLIELFLDGNLDMNLDMNRLFYDYAIKLNVTDKAAIANVMTTIDIPEIEGI